MKCTPDQQKKLHSMFRDLSKQVKWAGVFWSEEDWKFLMLGAQFGQTIGPNPFKHGIVVMNNRRSRDIEPEDMTDFISEIQAFGDQEGVRWSDPNIPPIELYESP